MAQIRQALTRMSSRVFGGLAFRELLLRTARESWDDDVFGQAARLGFYHFLALFPSLLLLFMLARPGSAVESSLRDALLDSIRHVIPERSAALIGAAASELHGSAGETEGVWVSVGSALWASVNGAYAMITGLNVAYEVKERRTWLRVFALALALTIFIAALTVVGLAGAKFLAAGAVYLGAPALEDLARWIAISGALLLCLGVFYRFAPNLANRRWQWSTPGAVFGAAMWIGASLALRFWTDRSGSYPRIYGRRARGFAPDLVLRDRGRRPDWR